MNNRLVLGFAIPLLACGCGRDFEPPPGGPAPVELHQVVPDRGFFEDEVELLGAHFAPDAGENTVFFGAHSAAVLELRERPGDDTSPQSLLVAVPRLTAGERVAIKVVAPSGQASLEGAFLSEGDGHPLRGEVTGERMPRALPVAAFSLPGHDSPIHGVLNRDSREVALLFEENGLQVHSALCAQPLAAAAALIPVNGGLGVQIWVSTLEVGGTDGVAAATGLIRLELRWSLNGLTFEFVPPEDFALPADGSWAPWPLLVWAVCPSQACLTHRVIVSDAAAPRLYRIQPGSMAGSTPEPEVLDFAGVDLRCGEAEGVGVIDLKQDPESLDLFALAVGGRQVWRVPAAGGAPELAFALGDLGAVVAEPCAFRASALAVDRLRGATDPERVYLALVTPLPAILVAERDAAAGWQEKFRVYLDGFPYAAVVGRLPREGGLLLEQHLFVATSLGLRSFALEEGRPELVLAEAAAVSINSTGALAVDEAARTGLQDATADRVLMADPTGDWLRIYLAGREGDVSSRLPVSSPVPELARGDASGALFLGDPLSNAIRVIDADSGAQLGQFGVRGAMGFATTGLQSIPLAGGDLLLAPVAQTGTDHPAPYRGVVARLIGPASPAPDCRASLAAEPPLLLDIDDYDRMIYLPRPTPRLYFLRDPELDADPPALGRLWIVPVDPEAATAEAALASVPVLSEDLPLGLLRSALDPAGELLGLLVAEGEDVVKLHVIEFGTGEFCQVRLESVLADQVSDLAVVRPRASTGAAGLVLLSVPISGQILAAAIAADGSIATRVLETGGAPQALAVSPDRRQAYAVHPAVGQVSAIDLDCSPLPDCLRVVSNLRVADLPYALQFSPDGGEVLVLHLYNGRITVIE